MPMLTFTNCLSKSVEESRAVWCGGTIVMFSKPPPLMLLPGRGRTLLRALILIPWSFPEALPPIGAL